MKGSREPTPVSRRNVNSEESVMSEVPEPQAPSYSPNSPDVVRATTAVVAEHSESITAVF
jgi:hypothetical protein